ncbi:hypothetical protein [Seonamhaeicola sp. S2-3]|uniref:hypothetical protein n=1 Tax=Seonamhaeicola sp. S2-3 TaxID=1936081 RepID=UPI0012FB06E7|nr:hypothetical protein [Seonamhaeicola sp. S2-3]
MKKNENRRVRIMFIIIGILFFRSLFLFIEKGVPNGFDNWKFYVSLLGTAGFLGLFIFSIKQIINK